MPPPEWYLSQVCSEFGIPPSVAKREESADVDAIMVMRRYERDLSLVMQEDMDEERLLKVGLSQERITEIMENIEMSGHDQR